MLRLARALDLPVEDLAAPIATELVFDDRFYAESGNCYLWADEPTFGRVRFLISGEVMTDVLKAGNPVNRRRLEEVAERKRRRIEAACRRAFAREQSDRVVVRETVFSDQSR